MRQSLIPPTLIPDRPISDHGLLCERVPAWLGRTDDPISPVARVNVVQELWPYGDCGLDWWGGGCRPASLALAVLDHFLPRRPGELVEANGVRLACSWEAWELHLDASIELLAPIPFWGGLVTAAQWRSWIRRAQARQRAGVRDDASLRHGEG